MKKIIISMSILLAVLIVLVDMNTSIHDDYSTSGIVIETSEIMAEAEDPVTDTALCSRSIEVDIVNNLLNRSPHQTPSLSGHRLTIFRPPIYS